MSGNTIIKKSDPALGLEQHSPVEDQPILLQPRKASTPEMVPASLERPEASRGIRDVLMGGQATWDMLDTAAANSSPPTMSDVKSGGAYAFKSAVEALSPSTVVGGISDAINAMAGVMEIANERFPTGGTQVFDPQGNFDPRFLNAEEMAVNLDAQDGEDATMGSLLPRLARPDTVPGNMARGVSQFLMGYEDTSPIAPISIPLVEFMAPIIGVWPGQVLGDCLGTILPSGRVFGASPGLDLDPGCLVAIADTAGAFHGKIFLGKRGTDKGPVFIVGQINPPLVRFYPEDEIVAMHRLWFWLDDENKPQGFDMAPAEALDYLFKPLHGSKCGAVNSDWRPPGCNEFPTPEKPERTH